MDSMALFNTAMFVYAMAIYGLQWQAHFQWQDRRAEHAERIAHLESRSNQWQLLHNIGEKTIGRLRKQADNLRSETERHAHAAVSAGRELGTYQALEFKRRGEIRRLKDLEAKFNESNQIVALPPGGPSPVDLDSMTKAEMREWIKTGHYTKRGVDDNS